MERGEYEFRSEKITSRDLEKSLQNLSKEDWERANFPLVTFASKKSAAETNEGCFIPFWRKALNPNNFIYPNSEAAYDPEKHSLYILHSFSKPGKQDVIFKAITTNPKNLLKNPEHMINYKYHGKDGGGGTSSYPTCFDFWEDFYDKLPEDQQDYYPILSLPWRQEFILEKYFGE